MYNTRYRTSQSLLLQWGVEMKLNIQNVARIANASMEFNGITVLVGDNNTGKTTVGRVVFSFFHSLVDIANRVPRMRQRKYSSLLNSFARNHGEFFLDDWSPAIELFLKGGEKSDGDFRESVRTAVEGACSDTELNDLIESMRKVRDLSDHEIQEQIVTNVFKNTFSGEYMPARARNENGSFVRMTVKGHEFLLSMERDSVRLSEDFPIEHDAYFIDTPDLLSDISQTRYWGAGGDGLGRDLVRKIAKNMRPMDDLGESAIDDILARNKIEQILNRIASVIHGKVTWQANNRVGFADDEMNASFRLENLSRGVRAFALLQTAIRYRVLKDQDVLILDEPEIHLHPDWLMNYAETLVILQEELNLTVLVTTHSAYFLQALQLYARKHNRLRFINAYKAVKGEDGNVDIATALGSDNWDEAYMPFLLAANRLRRLRDEVENLQG